MKTNPTRSDFRLSPSVFCFLLLFLLSLPAAVRAQYAFTNFVGLPGVSGTNNGTANTARFNVPTRPAMDSAGNLFLADAYNHTIRRITPAGEVATLVGMAGIAGSADGSGTAAQFNQPHAVALDATGNIFVPDWGNHTIRKVTPAGVVTTLAGSPGNAGWVDATGSAARFNMPECVTVDSNGNIFVAERDNFVIRKVTPAGVVTTLAGSHGVRGWADGYGSAALFNDPSGIAVDSAGNLFVGDRGNDAIRKVTQAGEVTTLAGSPGNSGWADGVGSAARFYRPSGMAVDNLGNVFVTEERNHTIRKVTYTGVVTTIGGLAGVTGTNDGVGSDARFNIPAGAAVDGSGALYVSDALNHRITKGTASPPSPPFTWVTNNGAITITGYTGQDWDVTVPATINGLPVTSIGGWAFGSRTRLYSITIPAGVTNLGQFAFSGCDYLASVTLPPSLTSIGQSAFQKCSSLTNIVIPNGITTIEDFVFDQCFSLSGVSLPPGITSIGGWSFASCGGLTSLVIPNSLTNIGPYAFSYCGHLRALYFEGNPPNLASDPFYATPLTAYYLAGTTGWGSTLDSRPAELWDPQAPFRYVTNNGTITITGYIGPGGTLAVPATFGGLPVTAIGDSAFRQCYGLTHISFPPTLVSIEHGAFYDCENLVSAILPSSLANIGPGAFYSCGSLADLTIPNSVSTIGGGAFVECIGLTAVLIPSGVSSIGGGAFAYCRSLTAIDVDPLNPHYTSLNGVLFNRPLTELIQYPAGLSGNYAIPGSVTNIWASAFDGCGNLTGISIPNGVVSIGAGAFSGCTSLDTITIPNGITTIETSTFSSCGNLTSATIPPSVTHIGWQAFGYCNKLKGLYFQGDAPSTDSSIATAGTVYYLPGTIGWGPTLGGCPTALWQLPYPVVLTASPTFGIQASDFGFTISWAGNTSVVIEAATSLTDPTWVPISTNTLIGGSAYFNDSNWTNYPSRLYRIRSP